MSDTSSGDEPVAASEETPTEPQGEAVSDQTQTQAQSTEAPATSGATESDAAEISRLRVAGHDLYDTFTWRADDESDPVVITRDGTDIPSGSAQDIIASAALGGIKLEAC